jgi:hypothetical protein
MKTYDPRCWELAKTFLADEPPELRTDSNTDELAQEIQDAIERWLESPHK